ncbi:SDR family NAD(P)-dependent oxidoreductase [Kordiimonas laminariae]|uniref:SDR family NAD(P)-dependent oxidoreductase n=1 Tax=Kordiimonas laminariae TaxID=2917717 RepID=UPI001FF4D36A|nr:SDR family NAD(P)-dependent oxidoreductase [Kordiimonas laminariae]MCK0069365.1 SDR family NAD(P)-dependent oxidoreductase [Kordiimonas laminariae]
MEALASIPKDGQAIIIGSSGAIGAALEVVVRKAGFPLVHCFNRSSGFDLTSEVSIKRAAEQVKGCDLPVRFLFIATGFLHDDNQMPEKSMREITPQYLEKAFKLNAIGPALVLKCFTPFLARREKAVVAALSAKVGSIEDNQLGGWYGYRASKAALNQLIKTSAIELKRRNSDTLCVALHPGTVASRFSKPFQKTGLDVRLPSVAAEELAAVVDALDGANASGGFYDYKGNQLPW